jgi:hypothetical protein
VLTGMFLLGTLAAIGLPTVAAFAWGQSASGTANVLKCDCVHIDSAKLSTTSFLDFERRRKHRHVRLAFDSWIGSG